MILKKIAEAKKELKNRGRKKKEEREQCVMENVEKEGVFRLRNKVETTQLNMN
ncbi:hypothetical protein HF876_10220 [Psychrobacillus sp. BL-248-WT-3]|nr:hypothetical protein [Psychrobacillus sp. BL-248-WT-3]